MEFSVDSFDFQVAKDGKRWTAKERDEHRRMVREVRELELRAGERREPLNKEPIEPGQLKVVCDSMLQVASALLSLLSRTFCRQ